MSNLIHQMVNNCNEILDTNNKNKGKIIKIIYTSQQENNINLLIVFDEYILHANVLYFATSNEILVEK